MADIYALLNDPDRFVRYAGRLALERTPRGEWADRVLRETDPARRHRGPVRPRAHGHVGRRPAANLRQAAGDVARRDLSVDDRLRLLRAFQLTATASPGGAPRNSAAACTTCSPISSPPTTSG
jgi:hypothetical protein